MLCLHPPLEYDGIYDDEFDEYSAVTDICNFILLTSQTRIKSQT